MDTRIDPRQLSELIVTNSEIAGKVQEIADTATSDTALSGKILWASLIYSGISLGVQEAERVYVKRSLGFATGLRECIASVDAAAMQLPDESMIRDSEQLVDSFCTTMKESTTALRVVRKKFQEILDLQAQELGARKLAEVKAYYGIEPGLMTCDLGGSCQGDTAMGLLGYRASIQGQHHFIGWCLTKLMDSPPKMTCKCPSCYGEQITAPIDIDDVMERISRRLGDLSKVFSEFGRDTLDFQRKQYRDAISGISQEDTHGSTDAGELAKDMIARLKGVHRGE